METALQHTLTSAVVVATESSGGDVADVLVTDATVNVVGVARSALDALALIRDRRPDLLILIVGTDVDQAIDVCRMVIAQRVDTPVLVLETHENDSTLASLVKLGVSGYLPQSTSSAELARAARDVAEGRMVFPPTIAGKVRALVMDSSTPNDPITGRDLSEREMEVLGCLTQGLGNQAIAEKLAISEKTVHTHVRHVLLKLGVRSRTQAAVKALKKQWF